MLSALKNAITARNGTKFTVDELIILGALKSRQLDLTDIEVLFKLIEEQSDKHNLINVQIELYTNHRDYVQAFKCLLKSKSEP